MRPNPHFLAALVTFTEEFLNFIFCAVVDKSIFGENIENF